MNIIAEYPASTTRQVDWKKKVSKLDDSGSSQLNDPGHMSAAKLLFPNHISDHYYRIKVISFKSELIRSRINGNLL